MGRRGCGIDAFLERASSDRAASRALEQLGVGVAAEAATQVGEALQLALDLLEPVRLGFERKQERTQLAGRLAKSQLDVAELASRARQLRSEMLERRQSAFRSRRQPGRSLALLGSERLCRRGRALRELGYVPEPLALLEQRLLGPGLEPVRVLRERAQLRQAGLGRGRVARELVVSPAG